MRKIVCIVGICFFSVAFTYNSVLAVANCGLLYERFLEWEKQERGEEFTRWGVIYYFGYVEASHTWYASINAQAKGKTGLPENVTTEQLARILGKYLKENPELHHKWGVTCFWNAMKEAFPEYD